MRYVLTAVLAVLGEGCIRCECLEEELEYERKNSAYLQSLLFQRVGLVKEDVSEPETTFQSTRPRRLPWSMRRREVERKHKLARKEEKTQAEQIFEEELNASEVRTTVSIDARDRTWQH